jgi:hypothetical protein
MNAFIPQPSLDLFLYCGYELPSGRICGKPSRASAEGPRGEYIALCAEHAAAAVRYIRDPRWSDWTLEVS